mmetsp:Transcript_100502/g.307140  ORF Transcript_100502/g.307140 Transcript_100502/m.307140 type:complete len:216 (-) Transcript_100502:145-792(-)
MTGMMPSRTRHASTPRSRHRRTPASYRPTCLRAPMAWSTTASEPRMAFRMRASSSPLEHLATVTESKSSSSACSCNALAETTRTARCSAPALKSNSAAETPRMPNASPMHAKTMHADTLGCRSTTARPRNSQAGHTRTIDTRATSDTMPGAGSPAASAASWRAWTEKPRSHMAQRRTSAGCKAAHTCWALGCRLKRIDIPNCKAKYASYTHHNRE